MGPGPPWSRSSVLYRKKNLPRCRSVCGIVLLCPRRIRLNPFGEVGDEYQSVASRNSNPLSPTSMIVPNLPKSTPGRPGTYPPPSPLWHRTGSLGPTSRAPLCLQLHAWRWIPDFYPEIPMAFLPCCWTVPTPPKSIHGQKCTSCHGGTRSPGGCGTAPQHHSFIGWHVKEKRFPDRPQLCKSAFPA